MVMTALFYLIMMKEREAEEKKEELKSVIDVHEKVQDIATCLKPDSR